MVIKEPLIAVFIGNGIVLCVISGIDGEGQLQAVLVLIGIILPTEVVVCAVLVLPAIIVAVYIPLENALVEVCTPAVTQAKVIAAAVVGVIAVGSDLGAVVGAVNMGNRHRHAAAAKSHVRSRPNQVAGIAVNIACARTACGNGGIVPIVFNTVGIAEADGKGGHIIGNAKIR